jgi:hypothetical protein
VVSVRELELIARNLRGRDATLIRKDIAVYGADIQREAAAFMREVTAQAKRDKAESVVLLAILKD